MVGSINGPRPEPVQVAAAAPASGPQYTKFDIEHMRCQIVWQLDQLGEWDESVISNKLELIDDPRVLRFILQEVSNLAADKKISRKAVDAVITRAVNKYRSAGRPRVEGATGTAPAGTQPVTYANVMHHIFERAERERAKVRARMMNAGYAQENIDAALKKIEDPALEIAANIMSMNERQLGEFFAWVKEIEKREPDPVKALERIRNYSEAWNVYVFSLKDPKNPGKKPYGGDF